MNDTTDETSTVNQSITPATPGIINLPDESIPPKRPKITIFITIFVMLLFIVGIAGWKAHQISQAIARGKSFKMPPDAVTSLKVSEKSVSPVLEAVGSLSSPQGVTLSADLPGIVTAIAFESGTAATNGQIHVQLDTRQEQAQ